MGDIRPRRRGIYLLPTCFTIGNLFCGFFSLVQSSRGAFKQAALLIVVAGILDGLDGRIARLTGTTSDFGLEFDSLADITSFGIAPAFLAYQWALLPLHRIGWLVAFLYLVCAATRLARFNLQHRTGDKRFFAGLPSPAAAGVVACVAFAFPDRSRAAWPSGLLAIVLVGCALLMVSRIRYRSFTEFDLRNRRSYIYVLPLAAILVLIAYGQEYSLLVFSWLYLASGPLGALFGLLWRGRSRSADRSNDIAEAEGVADEPALR